MRRAVRALAAAQASLQAGEFDAALGLAGHGRRPGRSTSSSAPWSTCCVAQVTFAAGPWSDAPPLLLKAARRLESFDLDLARETYLTAWGAAGLAEDVAARDVLVEICRAVRALPRPPGAPRPRRPAARRLRSADHRGTRRRGPDVAASSRWRSPTCPWRTSCGGAGWPQAPARRVWDHEGWLASCTRQVQVVRDAGALAALPIHLTYLGMAIVWTGDFAGAASLVAEVESVAAVTGSRFPPYTLLRLARTAGQGRRGIRSDSERDRAIRRAGHDGPAGVLGGRGPVQRPRSLRGGGIGGLASDDRRPQPLDTHVGRCPSSSRQPHAEGTPSSPAMRSSDWRRRRSPAAPSSRSASKRAAGRC